MTLELLWHEASPYLYMITGVLALASADSPILIICGALLVLAALSTMRLRWASRYNRELIAQTRRSLSRARITQPRG
jgi:hypothetical protein